MTNVNGESPACKTIEVKHVEFAGFAMEEAVSACRSYKDRVKSSDLSEKERDVILMYLGDVINYLNSARRGLGIDND